MDEKSLYELLKSVNIPVAYDHFVLSDTERIEPPFILYRNADSTQFKAGDQVYFKTKQFMVDLVTDYKDIDLENMLEEVFEENYIPWDKTEVYIDSERVFQVVYYL